MMARGYLSAIFVILTIASVFRAKAQINTACSSSMISTFTPCLNYVTGSSGTGSSPTEDCCNSLKSLMTDNMNCACLIVTGNVPVSMPFVNANLAISLPQACKSSVPLLCKATGVPLPAPGPVLFGPTLAPAPHSHSPRGFGPAAAAPAPHIHSPRGSGPAPGASPSRSHSPRASKAAAVAAPPPVDGPEMAPASPPKLALGPGANPGIRPVVIHKSASASSTASLPLLFLIFAATMAFMFS